MIYDLVGSLHTDGDFSVDLERMKLSGQDSYIEKDGCESYSICLHSESPYVVRDFLDALTVCYSIGPHAWLVKDLYEMTQGVREHVFSKEPIQESRYLSGNYDGTYLTLTINDPSERTTQKFKRYVKDKIKEVENDNDEIMIRMSVRTAKELLSELDESKSSLNLEKLAAELREIAGTMEDYADEYQSNS